jgi:hypothetical protein
MWTVHSTARADVRRGFMRIFTVDENGEHDMEERTARVVHIKDNIDGAIYIGRANGRARLKASPFANPFKVAAATDRLSAIRRYEEHLVTNPSLWSLLPKLRGRPLACWCRHEGEKITAENLCHGDVLVRLLQQYSDEEILELGQT